MIHIEGELLEPKGARVNCSIAGSAEVIAFEYATITKQLLDDKKGQTILKRATDILEEIMKENNDEEERKC